MMLFLWACLRLRIPLPLLGAVPRPFTPRQPFERRQLEPVRSAKAATLAFLKDVTRLDEQHSIAAHIGRRGWANVTYKGTMATQANETLATRRMQVGTLPDDGTKAIGRWRSAFG